MVNLKTYQDRIKVYITLLLFFLVKRKYEEIFLSMLVGCLEFGEKGKAESDSIDGGEGLEEEQAFCKGERQFAGHEFDEDVQLYYARARWYDPEMGRFITEDPVKDGGNWYAYAANNPLRFVDPSGLASVNQVPRSTHAKESGSRGDYYHLSQQEIDQLKDRTDTEWRAVEQYTELLEVINTVNDNKIPQQFGEGLTPDNISGISQGKTGFSITTESGYYYSFDKETFELTEFGEQGAIPTNDELLIVGLVQIGRKLVKAGIKKIVSKFGKENVDDIIQNAANKASKSISQTGRVGGTLKHTAAEKIIKNTNINAVTEVSYLKGRVVPRGTPGSIRLDVVTGTAKNPKAIFDFKFGKAGLSAARINQIRSHLPDPNILILEVRPR